MTVEKNITLSFPLSTAVLGFLLWGRLTAPAIPHEIIPTPNCTNSSPGAAHGRTPAHRVGAPGIHLQLKESKNNLKTTNDEGLYPVLLSFPPYS